MYMYMYIYICIEVLEQTNQPSILQASAAPLREQEGGLRPASLATKNLARPSTNGKAAKIFERQAVNPDEYLGFTMV